MASLGLEDEEAPCSKARLLGGPWALANVDVIRLHHTVDLMGATALVTNPGRPSGVGNEGNMQSAPGISNRMQIIHIRQQALCCSVHSHTSGASN